MPSTAHLTVSLYLCSSGSNAQGESRAREGRCVSSKNPSRRRRGSCWEERKRRVFPRRGVIVLPSGKSMSFHKKETEKIELVARPGSVGVNGERAIDSTLDLVGDLKTRSQTATLKIVLRLRFLDKSKKGRILFIFLGIFT